MHSDVGTSAFIMVTGRKRWVLFPASESAYFLPIPHASNVAYNSLINIFGKPEIQHKLYPWLHLAKGWEIILNPGDVLFFPSFTWHGVSNLDPVTIGVDIPTYDIVPSLRRNPVLALGTIGNVKVWFRAIYEFLKGSKGSLKEIYFQGYYKDEHQKQIAVDVQNNREVNY